MLINSAFIKSYGLVMSLLMIWVMLPVHPAEARDKSKAAPFSSLRSGMTPKQEMSDHTDDLRALMLQLYNDHPEELAKSTQVGAREMTEWVFDGKANWKFDAIRNKQQAEAINLIFDQTFTGDRVLALIVGLETFLFNAYGGQNEYEIPALQSEQNRFLANCRFQELIQKITHQNIENRQMIFSQSTTQKIQSTLQAILNKMQSSAGKKPDQGCLLVEHS